MTDEERKDVLRSAVDQMKGSSACVRWTRDERFDFANPAVKDFMDAKWRDHLSEFRVRQSHVPNRQDDLNEIARLMLLHGMETVTITYSTD